MAFRSSAKASSSSGGTITATPAGVQAHDYLGATYVVDSNTATLNAPAGWTNDSSNVWGSGAPDGGQQFFAFKADASGADAFGFSDSNGATGNSVVVGAWSGRDNASPHSTARVKTLNTTSNVSPVSATITGITATLGDDIAVFMGTDQTVAGGRWTFSQISGYTEREDGVATDWVSGIALDSLDNASAGATGNFATTITNSGAGNAGYGGIGVAIKAGAAAAVLGQIIGNARIASRGVGPLVLRFLFRQPPQGLFGGLTVEPPAPGQTIGPVIVPGPRVGPQVLRRNFRRQQFLAPPPAGGGPQQFLSDLTATLSFAGARSVAVTKGLAAATLSFAGAVLKRTSRALAGTLSFSGALAQGLLFVRALTATLSFVGAQSRRVNKALAGTLSFAGAMQRAMAKLQAGTLSFVGALTKRTATARTATLSFAGGFLTGQAYIRALTATLSFSGALASSRVTLKALTATLSFVGAITRRPGKAVAATLSFSGAQARRIGHQLAASLGFVGAVARRTARAFAGGLGFVGALIGGLVGAPERGRIIASDSAATAVAVSDGLVSNAAAGDAAATRIQSEDS